MTATFRYKAVDPDGRLFEGVEEAPSREALIFRLRDKGAIPIRAEPWSARAAEDSGRSLFRRKRVRAQDVAYFTRDLSVLLQSGLPLDQALSTLAEFASSGPASKLTADVLSRIQSGATLGDAIEAAGPVFPSFYSGMVRAGEAGGALNEVMARLAAMLEQRHALAEQVRTAMFYPMLVLVLTGLSLAVLLTFVIPQFEPLFEQAGSDLPTITRIVLAASAFVRGYSWAMALALLGLAVALRWHNATPSGRLRLGRINLALPLLGQLTRQIETAKFCRVLGTTIQNGVPLLDAVTMASHTVANGVIAAALDRVSGPLSRGEGLARPLADARVFPPLAVHLIRVGEESGQLAQMLLRVADIFDVEIRRTIERLLSLLVPLVTIGLGILIALIVGSILAAILQSYQVPL